jgi:hypothetical protein
MLIRLIKLYGWLLYKSSMWFVLPVCKVVYRLTWKGTLAQFVIALTEDADVVRMATDSGMADYLGKLQERALAMANAPRPPTEEDRMWGDFLTHYGENPQPDIVPEYFRYLLRQGTTSETEMPNAGAIAALAQRHPDHYAQWRVNPQFLELFEHAALLWQQTDLGRTGGNDFYMAQWFILRTDTIAQIIAKRTELPGMAGATCRWMMSSVANQMADFRAALERVGYEFPAPDMKQAVEEDIGVPCAVIVPDVRPERYPLSLEAANEILRPLAGATVLSAEMTETDMERLTIKTARGEITVKAPELGICHKWNTPPAKETPC